MRARIAGTAVAALLLIFHRVTDQDGLYALVVVAYGTGTAAGVAIRRGLSTSPAFWLFDGAFALALVLAGGNWRSPVYLLALTALILPATAGPRWRGVAATGAFAIGYLTVALFTGVDWNTLDTTPRLESFSAHLSLPLLLGIGLAYMAELLRHLDRERVRSSELALEAERRRLARELHDSAKQRIHAAHLVLSSLPPQRHRSRRGRDRSGARRARVRWLGDGLEPREPSQRVGRDDPGRRRAHPRRPARGRNGHTDRGVG